MRWLVLSLPVLGALASTSAFADDPVNGSVVAVDARAVFVPVGFDDNDEAVVVIDGYLPSGCYRLVRPEVAVDADGRVIAVKAMARYFDVPCVEARIPFFQDVQLGVLPQGKYTVTTNGGQVTERLDVAEANNAGPDDFLYAPVETASVEKEPGTGRLLATIKGRFTNVCMRLTGVKVADSGKTIVLQPLMAMSGDGCDPMETPFSKVVPLPSTVTEGRHLLHIRSLNGQAVNFMFNK